MKLTILDKDTGGNLLLIIQEPELNRWFGSRVMKNRHFTIPWNNGPLQTVVIDDHVYNLPANTLLPLMFNQSFSYERPLDIIAWQFNREFYCMIDHDSEVSCAGFLLAWEKIFLFLLTMRTNEDYPYYWNFSKWNWLLKTIYRTKF